MQEHRHAWWVLAVFAGCSVADAKDPDPPAARFEHDMMVRFHMHENFDLLRAIEKLLLRGKRDEATALARAISEAPDEPGLGELEVHAIRVRDLAAALARAPSIDEACAREARLAVACAGCHTATGVTPALSSVPALPPDRPTIDARMARHVWATDRLWEAAVGGGDEPWAKGLEVLAAAPLPFRASMDDRAGLAKQLQRLASSALKRRTTDNLAERGRAYGEILTVCATCHMATTSTSLPNQR
jgi:cytochrome c553